MPANPARTHPEVNTVIHQHNPTHTNPVNTPAPSGPLGKAPHGRMYTRHYEFW